MNLHAIVRALGGELYRGGQRASIPAPGHSPADRSVSLLLSDGRVLIHSFGAASWQSVGDDLRSRGLIDERGAPIGAGVAQDVECRPCPTHTERTARARAIWEEGSPVRSGTPAARYVRRRAISASPSSFESLRSHPTAPLSAYRATTATRPALLAKVSDPTGALAAVEITYLTPGGSRAVGMRLPRKTIGTIPAGSAVRLSSAARSMVVGEGVFTTLSAMEQFGLPGWALLSTSNMRRWTPPAGVNRVLIAADRGTGGEAAAEAIRGHLDTRGVSAIVALPPAPFGDWNEVAQASRR